MSIYIYIYPVDAWDVPGAPCHPGDLLGTPLGPARTPLGLQGTPLGPARTPLGRARTPLGPQGRCVFLGRNPHLAVIYQIYNVSMYNISISLYICMQVCIHICMYAGWRAGGQAGRGGRAEPSNARLLTP